MDDQDWVGTREAAALWTETAKLGENIVFPAVSDEKVRRMCRTGALRELGVEYIKVGRQFAIRRSSLLWYLWITAQETSRRAEALAGIGQERVYRVIGEVGEKHHGDGRAMDEFWRDAMEREFKKGKG